MGMEHSHQHLNNLITNCCANCCANLAIKVHHTFLSSPNIIYKRLLLDLVTA